MLLKILFLLLSILYIFIPLNSCKAQEIEYCREVILNHPENEKSYYHIHDFFEPKVKTKTKLIYFSYYKDSIFQTQGSFYGHLLHGSTRTLYSNNSLKIQGQFYLGLKHGVWLYWNTNGILRFKENWKKGRRHGFFETYDPDGKLILKTKYKKDHLQDKVIRYANGEIVKEEKTKKKKVDTPKQVD